MKVLRLSRGKVKESTDVDRVREGEWISDRGGESIMVVEELWELSREMGMTEESDRGMPMQLVSEDE